MFPTKGQRPLRGTKSLPFAPRERERFVITIYHDKVEVVHEEDVNGKCWRHVDTIWHIPEAFHRLLLNWAMRQSDYRER